MGSILIGPLAAALSHQISADPRISAVTRDQAGIRLEAGEGFGPTSQVAAGLAQTSVPPDQAQALVERYADTQLVGLKAGLLAAAAIALVSLALTTHLPSERPCQQQEPPGPPRAEAGRPPTQRRAGPLPDTASDNLTGERPAPGPR